MNLKAIIVIGKPGSGKSVMIWYLHSLLNEDNYRVVHWSDRLSLEKSVLQDTRNADSDKFGIRTGSHSKLIADGPPGMRKVHVTDGKLLNDIHSDYIKRISAARNKSVYLIEYATGPVINFGPRKIPLYQDGKYLVRNLKKNHILNSVYILDIEAKLEIRQKREARRADAMDPLTFRSYFPDGGEITRAAAKKLGKFYYRFVNHTEDYDGYFSEARHIYDTLIRPHLI